MEFACVQELVLPDAGPRDVVDACFHPDQPYVYLATSSAIFTYNLLNGVLSSQWRTSTSGRLISLAQANKQPSIAVLFDSGDVYLLSLSSLTLQVVAKFRHPPGKTPITAFAISSSSPTCFFLRKENNQLFSMSSPPLKSLPKFEAKRPLISFAFIPEETIAILGSSDGRIQLVNTATGAVVYSTDEFGRVDRTTNHQPHFLVFDTDRSLLFAASREGLLAVWQAFQETSTNQWRLDRFASVSVAPIRGTSLGLGGLLYVLQPAGHLVAYNVYPSTTGFSLQVSGFVERQAPFAKASSSSSAALQVDLADKNSAPSTPTKVATKSSSANTPTLTPASASSTSSSTTMKRSGLSSNNIAQLAREDPSTSSSSSSSSKTSSLSTIRAMFFHRRANFALFLPDNRGDASGLTSGLSYLSLPFAGSQMDASMWHSSVSDLGGEYGHAMQCEPVEVQALISNPEPARFLPVVAPQTLPSSFFLQQKPLFTFPQAIFPYVDGCRLLGFDIARRGYREIKELPEFDIMYDRPLHVRRIRYSPKLEHFLVFYAIDVCENEQPTHRYSYFSGNDESLKEGSDGCFLGRGHTHMALLTTNGRKIKVMPTTLDPSLGSQPTSRTLQNSVLLLDFPPSKAIRRVFPSCQPYGLVYWISTPEYHGLFPSVGISQGYQSALFQNFVPEQGLSFEIDTSYSLALETNAFGVRESVIDLQWQSFSTEDRPTHDLGAVLTTSRLLIINGRFEIITCVHSHCREPTPFLSCLWLDTCLLYTTQTHLNYLALDGTTHPICSMEPASMLCAVQNDRIYSAAHRNGAVKIFARNIGLLEPLLLGLSSIRGFLGLPDSSFQDLYQRALRRFDNGRVSSHLLESLRANSRHDLVFALFKNSNVQSPNRKFFAALRSRQFETAFDILRTKYKAWYIWQSNKVRSLEVFSNSPSAMLSFRSATLDYRHGASLQYTSDPDVDTSFLPAVPLEGLSKYPLVLSHDSPLYQQFQVLARTCIQHGQFELARRCYVLMDDRLSLLQLYTVHCSRQGVEAIAKVSAREGQAPLTTLCERLLQVRFLSNVQYPTPSPQPDEASGNSQEDQSLDEEIDSTVAEYSQLVLKNWSFVTPAVNWDTSQITSATMRVLGRSVPTTFIDIEPVGFLDTLDKWFPQPINEHLGKGWTFGKAEDELSPGRNASGANDRRILHVLPFAPLSIDPLPCITSSSNISSSSRPQTSRQAAAKSSDSKRLVEGAGDESKTIELSKSDFELVPLRLVAYLLEPPSFTFPDNFCFSHIVPPSPSSASTGASSSGALTRSGSDVQIPPPPPPTTVPSSSSALPSSSASPLLSPAPSPQQIPPPITGMAVVRGPPPAVPPLPPLPTTGAALLLKPDTQRDRKPHDYVGLAWQKLDAKQYPGALDDISHAIRLFVPPSPENNLMIKLCALYKLALKILIEMKLLHQSTDKERVVQLAMFLADIPILPLHRIPFLETAIQLCLESAKIETARRLFKLLQTKQPANIEQLRRRLIQSRSQPHQSELQMGDTGSADSSEVSCFPICYQSLQLLPPGSTYLKCIICESCYSEKEKKLGEACAVCNNGKLQQHPA